MSDVTVTHKQLMHMSEALNDGGYLYDKYLDFTCGIPLSGTYQSLAGFRIFSYEGIDVATYFLENGRVEYSFDAADKALFLAAFIARHVYSGGVFTEWHYEALSNNFKEAA